VRAVSESLTEKNVDLKHDPDRIWGRGAFDRSDPLAIYGPDSLAKRHPKYASHRTHTVVYCVHDYTLALFLFMDYSIQITKDKITGFIYIQHYFYWVQTVKYNK